MKDLRIFIIEDETEHLRMLKKVLKSIGHRVVGESGTAQVAYKELIELEPDIVLFNLNPKLKLKGLETAKWLCAELPAPIILMSSKIQDISISEVEQLGNFGLIQKPVDESDLQREIKFTFERSEKLQKLRRENINSKLHLKETEQFFEQVVNNVSDIIYRIDLKGVFTYLNPSAISNTGYDEELLYQTKFTEIVRADHRRKVSAFFQRLIKKEIQDAYLEVPIYLKNRQEIWLGQNIHLLRRKGKVIGFQVVARDITKEIQFKEELIKARNIAENTAELKSQFLANMSHEIRTPLNGIIGIIKLLERTPLNEKQHTYLRAVSTSSDQLMGIINDILDLSKIESGKMELNKVAFNFNELVRSLIDVMEIKAGMKGLKLSYHIDEELPDTLMGDPVSLNQILYNLIGNSLKFTQEGQIELKVLLRRECNNESCTHVELIVSDTGVGMKKEVQEKIFEAFTQAESSTTRQFGGTGLGLTIVKKLIDLQNGSIYVESEEDKGTNFHVHLCFDKSSTKTTEKNLNQTSNFSELADKRILVVEDNFVNQLVTKDLLEDVGSNVTIAENGLIALEKLNESSFDLILMDMQMPVMDGFETMRQIRSDKSKPHVPILALTANVVKSEIEKCMNSGASGYLSKPFMPEDLYTRIKNLLEEEASTTNSRTIKMDVLQSFTNGKESLTIATLKELHKVFREEMKDVELLLDEQDYRSVRSRMHKLKPNFQMIGVEGLYDLARQAEKTEDHVELKGILGIILNGMPDIMEQIEKECAVLENKLVTAL
jgi:PAS domain S-box-containing protein